MIKINIFDRTDNPIQIIEDCSQQDMVELINNAPKLIGLYDCKTHTTFSVPINKYIISWVEIDN